MKLTSIKKKIHYSINNSIYYKFSNKINVLTTLNVYWKIVDEIKIPNRVSIEDMQIRTINKLQNEIN